MTSRMNAPSAEANRSIAEVEKTVVSRLGLRMAFRTLSKWQDAGNQGKIRVDLLPSHGYQCRMPVSLPIRLFWTLALLACLVAPSPGRSASDETVTAERPAEYMIYQYPDTSLVLKLDVAEAEFNVQTFGPESALLKSSAVPGRRIGPVFQHIDSSSRARQLMIEVRPGRPVQRSAIRLEVLQFAAGDRNMADQLRAYQLFSVGTELARASDASTWASKAYSLQNAAGVFAALGMEEMRLWSEYFAAHLVLYRLNDPLMALELAGPVQAGANRAGYPQPELAARMLEAEAVLQLAAESGERSAHEAGNRASAPHDRHRPGRGRGPGRTRA